MKKNDIRAFPCEAQGPDTPPDHDYLQTGIHSGKYPGMTLRDQLVGVDSAFFTQVLNILDKKDNSQAIDFTYLVEIIDRVF